MQCEWILIFIHMEMGEGVYYTSYYLQFTNNLEADY